MNRITPAWEPNGSQDGFRIYLWAGAACREQERLRLVFPRLASADRYAAYLNAGNPQCASIDEVRAAITEATDPPA